MASSLVRCATSSSSSYGDSPFFAQEARLLQPDGRPATSRLSLVISRARASPSNDSTTRTISHERTAALRIGQPYEHELGPERPDQRVEQCADNLTRLAARPEGRQRHDADQIIQAATQSRDVFRRRSESGVHVTRSGPARPRRCWCVALSQSIREYIPGSS